MPFGFVPQLVMLFAFLLLPHGSLLCPAKPLHSLRLRFTRYPPLRSGHWVPLRLHSFQSLVSPPAAHNFARLLVASGCVRHWRISTHRLSLMRQYLPCVPIVWHKLRSLSRTLFILPHLQHRSPPLSYLKLPGFHPRLHSQDGSLKLHKCPQSVHFATLHFASFSHCSHFSHRLPQAL